MQKISTLTYHILRKVTQVESGKLGDACWPATATCNKQDQINSVFSLQEDYTPSSGDSTSIGGERETITKRYGKGGRNGEDGTEQKLPSTNLDPGLRQDFESSRDKVSV